MGVRGVSDVNNYSNIRQGEDHSKWLATITCEKFQTSVEYKNRPEFGRIIRDVKNIYPLEDLRQNKLKIQIVKLKK